MKYSNFLGSGLALAISVAAGGASAQVCSTGAGPFLFSAGEGVGERVADRIWRRLGENCFNLDGFIDAVSDLQVRDPRSCLGSGFVVGLNSVVDEVVDECTDECVDAGAELGDLLGFSFCGAFFAQAAGGPPPICTVVIDFSCNVAFIAKVNQLCPEAANDPKNAADLQAFAEQCQGVGI